MTHRCGVSSALGDIGRAGGDPPALRAAVMWPISTRWERAGRRRARTQRRLCMKEHTFKSQFAAYRTEKGHAVFFWLAQALKIEEYCKLVFKKTAKRLRLITNVKGTMILSCHSRASLELFSTLAALRLRAKKERVGVISLSTMLLSQGLSCMLRSARKE